MIISHEHRFVFIKTRKTGGSSVETLLRHVAGENAVITPLLPEPAGLREPLGRHWQGTFNPVPEMYRRWLRSGRGWRVRRRGIAQPLLHLRCRKRFYEHMPLELVRERAGRSIDGYFTFCFERNPWDKAVSWWAWSMRHHRGDDDPTEFDRWVLDPHTKGFHSDWPMYALNDEIAVDFVGRYEHFERDIRHVLDHLGIDASHVAIPHEKRSNRATLTMSRASRDRIAEIFSREIAAFGYECPSQLLHEEHPA